MFLGRVAHLYIKATVGGLREPTTQPYPRCEQCGREWHGLPNTYCLNGFYGGVNTTK